MSRFVHEPDKPKPIDPMVAVQREVIGQVRFGNSVAQDILSKIGTIDNKEIAAAIEKLAESMSKLADALKAMAPQKVELTKTITIEKTGTQKWKAEIHR